ncbi:MAG: hypothetical protein ACYCWE_02820 [Eubacteriales bacterium]
MTNNEKQRLCGGTFFTLLLQARKPRKGVREHYMGDRDGLSEPETLIALVKVVVPDFSDPLESMVKTIKGNTSEFKSCKNTGGTYYPFGDSTALQAFDTRVKMEYRSVLNTMSVFVNKFIDIRTSIKKDKCLVSALVELICIDDSIKAEQPFFICENGYSVTKAALADTSEICLQPFLLGVWHFAILRNEGNTIGKETYDTWCPPQNHGKREYMASLGDDMTQAISLSYYRPSKESSHESIKAKIVDDDSTGNTSDNTSYGTTQPVINNNPTFFNFNVTGNNNSFYNKVDTVNIRNGV